MASKFLQISVFKEIAEKISQAKGNPVYISPLHGSLKSLVVKEFFSLEKKLFIIYPDSLSLAEAVVELDILGLSDKLISITEFSPSEIQEKITTLTKKDSYILLSSYQLLNCILPEKEKITKDVTKIQIGGELSYSEIIEYLNLLNYQKDKFVEAPGDFSQRGYILDFWSYSENHPVRIEFDGDFIESIRIFDPESQRSIENINSVSLAAKINFEDDLNSTDIFDYIEGATVFASFSELQLINNKKINLFEEEIVTPVALVEKSIDEDEFPEHEVNNELVTEILEETNNIENNINVLLERKNIKWVLEEELNTLGKRINFNVLSSPPIHGNYEILFNTLKNFALDKYKIFLTTENEIQSARLKELLSEYNVEISDLIENGTLKIETLPVKEGFNLPDNKILVLSDYQIFGKPYRTKLPTSKKYKKAKSKTFSSIKKGDFVVHEDYGIGKYVGLETIKIGEVNQESMKILYAEGGIVYVNLNYLTLVKKYSSNENLVPTLSTLGTNEWVNTKSRTKKKIKEAARELILLYAKRKATKGYSFGSDTVWQKELEASFIYEDTPDQSKVTEEVKNDMEAENPMDRLVCGDVGFGKTEIAIRAAFKAVQEGKQAAILVPTTILAEQHFNTFQDRLSQFAVKVKCLSRFQTKKEQSLILKELKAGNVDVVIGTHRLISKDVEFKDLGLLIIDEEHRFGVTAKEKLRSIKINVDTLTLTATPIPRTLNLSLLGARDLSIVATPPPNRQPIQTTVANFDIMKIREWILNEIKRNGQVYVVHDRVHSIEKLSDYLKKYIPEISIGIAHGQMKPAQLEDVIHKFLNRKFDVLLSTKIIESGIDIPNVNTIIVNRADRFGLAELHQLRGRVGRSSRQAFAYFIVPSTSGITKKAIRRLQAIEEFTDVGAGFSLSMRDLEIRGAGNLLGTEQTGFINEVGFDLYVKLINETVEELKYEEFKEVFKNLPKQKEKTEPSIDSYFEIGIPQTYMPEQMDRLNFYTSLYSIQNLDELQELTDEIKDRFGPIPIMVERLVSSAELKYYASLALFERIIIQRNNISIILPRGEKEDYYKFYFVELMRYIVDKYKNNIKFIQQKEIMKLQITNNYESPEKVFDFLIKFCKEVEGLFSNINFEGEVVN